MVSNDRLVNLMVSRAQRLEHTPDIDRHTVTTLAAVPPRARTEAPTVHSSPWEAALAELCVHGVVDGSTAGKQLLDALLDSAHTGPGELAALLARPGLTDQQRHQILMHRHTPGDLIIDHVCDERHDTRPITAELIARHTAMLRNASGISAQQRTAGWTTLLLRAARHPDTQPLVSEVLMASPDASATLHATVARARPTDHIPAGLHPLLLSHLAAPATIALLTPVCLFRVLDFAEQRQHSADRLVETVVDMIAATCGPHPDRWARLFRLTPDWHHSIGDLLDTIDTEQAAVTVVGRRRTLPGYRRDHGSNLHRPMIAVPSTQPRQPPATSQHTDPPTPRVTRSGPPAEKAS